MNLALRPVQRSEFNVLGLICSTYQGGYQQLTLVPMPHLTQLDCDYPFISYGALNMFETNDLSQYGLG